MKWAELHRYVLELSYDNADVRTLIGIAQNPECMAMLERNYRAAGPLKSYIKKRMQGIVDSVAVGNVPQDAPRILSMLCHIKRTTSSYVSAADPECQRWARICESLDEDALSLLARMISVDEQVSQLACTTLSWTMSEFNRRGCPIAPFHDKH